MGQAVVDLADPLGAPPPASLSGTDDLLAQLAGDEIDRLLAEAESERPPAAAPAAEAAPPVAPAAPAPAVSEPAAPPAAVAVAAVAATPAADDDDLDSLLNELNQGGGAPPVPASGAAEPAAAAAVEAEAPKSLTDQVPDVLAQFGTPAAGGAATAPAPVAASPSPAVEPVEGVMSSAERDALNLSSLSDATAAAEQQDAVHAQAAVLDTETSPRLRPALRVLEWVNAPLSFVPDATRDTLGKVAILTLVNSIAVLIYVLFVRH